MTKYIYYENFKRKVNQSCHNIQCSGLLKYILLRALGIKEKNSYTKSDIYGFKLIKQIFHISRKVNAMNSLVN